MHDANLHTLNQLLSFRGSGEVIPYVWLLMFRGLNDVLRDTNAAGDHPFFLNDIVV